ncbi:MAG: hypothetical protein U5R31_03115 [Acidimicrobiia bacterium]|nr:hypothetical protein [Acidimicrobiia bacterium]
MVAPDAVLAATLCRIVAIAGHQLELPGIIGSPLGLTLFGALVGPPEAGKSAAANVAADLLPAPRGVLDRLPIGSGEGMVEILFEMVAEEGPDGKRQRRKRQTRHEAIFHIDEGAVLADLGARSGSTLLATMRTAYTHGTLGNTNASEERKRIVDGRQYVYGITMGIQPELAAPSSTTTPPAPRSASCGPPPSTPTHPTKPPTGPASSTGSVPPATTSSPTRSAEEDGAATSSTSTPRSPPKSAPNVSPNSAASRPPAASRPTPPCSGSRSPPPWPSSTAPSTSPPNTGRPPR